MLVLPVVSLQPRPPIHHSIDFASFQLQLIAIHFNHIQQFIIIYNSWKLYQPSFDPFLSDPTSNWSKKIHVGPKALKRKRAQAERHGGRAGDRRGAAAGGRVHGLPAGSRGLGERLVFREEGIIKPTGIYNMNIYK